MIPEAHVKVFVLLFVIKLFYEIRQTKKYKAEDYGELYKRMKKGEVNKKQAMEIMGACETTYYRVMREEKH